MCEIGTVLLVLCTLVEVKWTETGIHNKIINFSMTFLKHNFLMITIIGILYIH